MPGRTLPDDVQDLQGGQVAYGPGAFHIGGIIKEIGSPGQVLMVRLQAGGGQGLHRQPEIPLGQVVFVSQAGNRDVEAVVAFQVGGLGG